MNIIVNEALLSMAIISKSCPLAPGNPSAVLVLGALANVNLHLALR